MERKVVWQKRIYGLESHGPCILHYWGHDKRPPYLQRYGECCFRRREIIVASFNFPTHGMHSNCAKICTIRKFHAIRYPYIRHIHQGIVENVVVWAVLCPKMFYHIAAVLFNQQQTPKPQQRHHQHTFTAMLKSRDFHLTIAEKVWLGKP